MSASMAIAPASRRQRGRRRIKQAMVASAAAGLILAGIFAAGVVSLGPPPPAQGGEGSPPVVDPNGKLPPAHAMGDRPRGLAAGAKNGGHPGCLKLLAA